MKKENKTKRMQRSDRFYKYTNVLNALNLEILCNILSLCDCFENLHRK